MPIKATMNNGDCIVPFVGICQVLERRRRRRRRRNSGDDLDGTAVVGDEERRPGTEQNRTVIWLLKYLKSSMMGMIGLPTAP